MKRYEIEFTVEESIDATITIAGTPVDRKIYGIADSTVIATIVDLRGSPLTLFAAETGTTTTANPVTVDADTGNIEAWVEAPDYDIIVSGASITTYTQKIRRTESGFFNIKSYGAHPSASASVNSAAINAVVTATQVADADGNKGGIIFIPGGRFKHNGIIANETVNITFKGVGRAGTLPVSELDYTGTGVRGIDARSSYGLTFDSIGVTYSNSGFTGTLIDYGHSVLSDASWGKIIDSFVGFPVYMRASPVNTAAKLVDWQQAIFMTVKDSNFSCAQRGIVGMTTPGYSNGHTIQNSTFDHLEIAAIMNMGQKCSISDCGFERTLGGSGIPALGRAYYDDRNNGSFTYNLTIEDCWMGDGSGLPWVEVISPGTGWTGCNIRGNFMANMSTNACIKIHTMAGGSIIGNCFSGNTPIDASNGLSGVTITGNVGWADQLVKNIDLSFRSDISGNTHRDQSNFGGPDNLYLDGAHIYTRRESSDTFPGNLGKVLTATLQSAAGTGGSAAASLSAGSTDISGKVNVTAGTTGLGTGDLVQVTYAREWAGPGVTLDGQAPTIIICPANAVTADLRPYVRYPGTNPTSWQYFFIGCRVAPTSGQALSFNYWIVE